MKYKVNTICSKTDSFYAKPHVLQNLTLYTKIFRYIGGCLSNSKISSWNARYNSEATTAMRTRPSAAVDATRAAERAVDDVQLPVLLVCEHWSDTLDSETFKLLQIWLIVLLPTWGSEMRDERDGRSCQACLKKETGFVTRLKINAPKKRQHFKRSKADAGPTTLSLW